MEVNSIIWSDDIIIIIIIIIIKKELKNYTLYDFTITWFLLISSKQIFVHKQQTHFCS